MEYESANKSSTLRLCRWVLIHQFSCWSWLLQLDDMKQQQQSTTATSNIEREKIINLIGVSPFLKAPQSSMDMNSARHRLLKHLQLGSKLVETSWQAS